MNHSQWVEDELEPRPIKRQHRSDNNNDASGGTIPAVPGSSSALYAETDHRTSASNASDGSISGDDDMALLDQSSLPFEENDANPDRVDLLLARELTKLSMADREKVYFDLHGIPSPVEETPAMVNESIELLKNELGELKSVAYKKALAMDSSYVLDHAFLLRFLRTDRFDHKKAATRIAKFFDVKLGLFGPDFLVKEITQDALDEDDMHSLHRGGSDLPFRDRAGRLVYVHSTHPVYKVESEMRKAFYSGMVVTEDEETQLKGAVLVSYLLGQDLSWEQIVQRRALNREWGKVFAALPLRIEAFHLCADSVLWRPLFALFKFTTSLFNRVRIREHIGSHQEVQFALQTYGISTFGFPVSKDGESMGHFSTERWKKRRILEQGRKEEDLVLKLKVGEEKGNISKQPPPPSAASARRRVDNPGQNDILLGRGRGFYNHSGNVRLRCILGETYHLFEGAGHADKQKVSAAVVALIKCQSYRFLKEGDDGWVEVDDETAQVKVSHGFRTLRGLKNKYAAKTNDSSHGSKRRNCEEL